VETLHGKILGLVGSQQSAGATARLAAAFGMKVHVYRRHPRREAADPLVSETVEDKRELFARADYVVLAAPLTAETHHMVRAPELACMKPSAVLVNVGRGALVDESALVDALRRRAIRGAALDVFEVEPLAPDTRSSRWITSCCHAHCADRTATWQAEALDSSSDNTRTVSGPASRSPIPWTRSSATGRSGSAMSNVMPQFWSALP